METETKNDQFLETTVEHWLNTVNELGYQMPFCQVLLQDGYSVCHNSKQNAFEQGKDIIAIDKEGVPTGFQLKGGNISNARWRSEVYEEIRELVEYPIVHPSVKNGQKHISYLVTNGELEDTVRRAIDDLNGDRWKDTPLQVITKGALLKKFLDISSHFIPNNVTDYKTFIELYFTEGTGLIDEEQFCSFIEEILRIKEDGLSKAERKRNIASAVLFTSYIVAPFKNKGNHVPILQTLTLLIGYIFALVEKYSLNEESWKGSVQLIWEEMMFTGQKLQEEIKDDGFSKLHQSVWDGELGKFRKHLAMSYLFAYKLSQAIAQSDSWDDILEQDFLKKMQKALFIWGEAAFTTVFLVYFHMAKKAGPSDRSASHLLQMALNTLTKSNGRNSQEGLVSSYYGIAVTARHLLSQLEEPIDESFTGRSQMLWPLVELLSRKDERLILEQSWREISYIAYSEFHPEKMWMHYLWRCEEGEAFDKYPQETQSWTGLKEGAMNIDHDKIPDTIKNFKEYLPFFILVYPHRVTSNYIKYLDEVLFG